MGAAETLTSVRRGIADRPLTVVATVVVLAMLVDVGLGLSAGRIVLADVLTKAWDGIVIGLAIGLAGVGLSMTYSILSFANFAHGDYVTVGAFSGWAVTFLVAGLGEGSLGYLLLVGVGEGPSSSELGITAISRPGAVLAGLVVAALATVLLVLLVDRIVYRPMREEGGITLLIASIGVALALRYLVVFVFDPGTRGLTATTRKLVIGFDDGGLAVAGSEDALSSVLLNVTSHELTLVVTSLVLMLGIHLLLQRTKLGKAMRAMADNKDLARVTGIPTEQVIRATWIIGGGLAGAAGFLIALERGTISFNLGWILLLLIFAAVILGGIGSIYGAMAGGLIIGLVSRISLIWIPSSFATAAAFGVMIVVLLFRPEGIFGGVTTA